MAKTKVKRDQHGLYFRTDGSVYRPVPTSRNRALHVLYKDKPSQTGFKAPDAASAEFVEGEQVKVNHLAGTELASIKSLDGKKAELWYDHGCYFDSDPPRRSDECFIAS